MIHEELLLYIFTDLGIGTYARVDKYRMCCDCWQHVCDCTRKCEMGVQEALLHHRMVFLCAKMKEKQPARILLFLNVPTSILVVDY